jgi:hypothetical protein
MIRLIKMDGQVTDEPGNRMFAFWNTVTDSFVQVFDSWAWDSIAELEQDLDSQIMVSAGHSTDRHAAAIDRKARLLSLARAEGY